MSWHGIWENGNRLLTPPADPTLPIAGLTLHLELTGPKPAPLLMRRKKKATPIRLWQGMSSTAPISVYLMTDGAIRLLHGPVDVTSDPGMLSAGETLRLRYTACAYGRAGGLSLINDTHGAVQNIRCADPQRPTLAEALPAVADYISVPHVAAISGTAQPFLEHSGIAEGAEVATPEGPRAVETLQPGDYLLDPIGRPHPLERITSHVRLCLGRNAPLRLAAPYFGLAKDLTVTPQTRLLQTGPSVDYLCGEGSALAQARDLAAGRNVVPDNSAPVQKMFRLEVAGRICARINGCLVETARGTKTLAARPLLLDRSMAQAVATAAYQSA